jgi:hypothetical protein
VTPSKVVGAATLFAALGDETRLALDTISREWDASLARLRACVE